MIGHLRTIIDVAIHPSFTPNYSVRVKPYFNNTRSTIFPIERLVPL